MAENGRLGTGTYDAQIVTRVTHTPLGVLRVVNLDWGRVLDDVSGATIAGVVGGDWDTAECDLAANVRALEHELEVYRDGRLVWAGPLLEPDVGRDDITLTARDLLWWEMSGRVLHEDHSHVNVDLSTIFNDYILDADSPDPVGLTVTATPCGVLGTRTVAASDYLVAGDELAELMRTGVDITMYQRTAIVGGSQITAAPVGMLFDQHFVADVRAVERGFDTNTRVIVRGANGLVGIAGGTDGRVGLVERVFDEVTIEDQASLDANAQSRVDLNGEPPLHVEVPAGAQFAPSTPIPMEKLVPGVHVSVGLSASCRQVNEVQRLHSVDVSVTPDGGEAVKGTLQPIGTI